MVEFITLFLGLVAGPHEVAVMVDDRVAVAWLSGATSPESVQISDDAGLAHAGAPSAPD